MGCGVREFIEGKEKEREGKGDWVREVRGVRYSFIIIFVFFWWWG